MSTRGNDFKNRTSGLSGGAAGSAGLLSAVPDLAALTALNDAALINGAIVGVGTMQDVYELDKASVTAASGVDYVATLSGTGIWSRKFIGGNSWASQATWFVDRNIGDDEYDGTQATFTAPYRGPLQSLAEVFKRLRNNAPIVDMNISVAANDTSDMDLAVDFGTGPARFIQIVGTRTTVFSGAITGTTAYNDATSTADGIAVASLPASWTASGCVKQLLRITAAAGAYLANSVVAFETGARVARISRPMNIQTFAEYQPINTDIATVYTATKLGGTVTLNVKGNGELDFVDCDIGTTDALHAVQVQRGEVYFIACITHGLDYLSGSNGGVIAARINIGRVYEGAAPILDCIEADRAANDGGPALQVEPQGSCYAATPILIEGDSNNDCLLVREHGYMRLEGGASLAAYNAAGDGAIQIQASGLFSSATTTYVFGTGHTFYGILLKPGAFYSYDTNKPTITGASGDAYVAGYTIDWTMAPFTSPIGTVATILDSSLAEFPAFYAFQLSLAINAGIMPH